MKENPIITIDHGNKAIKNTVTQYQSGFVESKTEPILKQNLLEYGNKYYSIGSERFPVMTNKTVNDNFFILTLPSIAQTLKQKYAPIRKTDVILGVGLPIIHFGKQKDRFREYFIRDHIFFNYNEQNYDINIKDVYVFPQGYAGLMPVFHQYKGISKINVFDMGGYTLDAFSVEKGLLNIKSSISLPYGVVTLFNTLKQEILSMGFNIEENQLEELIMGEDITFSNSDDIKKLIQNRTEIYVADILNKLNEHGFEMKINPNVFQGGGSLLLKKYIETNKSLGYVEILDQYANVNGYEVLTRQAVERSG